MERICEPIKTLEELLKLTEIRIKKRLKPTYKETVCFANNSSDCHQVGYALQPRKQYDSRSAPKTLLCHDMKGGYLLDKYVHGCKIGDGYIFNRWSSIDTFVYFSHHFVTIPPASWVKVARKNNVRILGTIITESVEGAKICEEIFQSEESWRNCANALINVCLLYQFDGYLLNFENVIKQVANLVEFVKYLTEELHKKNEHYLVIWYDSVTSAGELLWQNELNDLNKCFFDVCDGIFLNYTWGKPELENTVKTAGDRIVDVYVGLDVFGRNFFGGGGFNCDLAARLIRSFGLSMAIFAPGWTHETLMPRTLENFYQVFLHRDNAFWLKLYPYLYTRPLHEDFVTTFYTGADKCQYNLRHQEKSLDSPVHSGLIYFTDICEEFCKCIQLNLDGYKLNRLSYLITTKYFSDKGPHVHRLFTCNISVSQKVVAETLTKEVEEVHKLMVVLLMENKKGKTFNYVLKDFIVPKNIRPEFEITSKDWNVQQFSLIVTEPMTLTEIGLVLEGKTILLGGFALNIMNVI